MKKINQYFQKRLLILIKGSSKLNVSKVNDENFNRPISELTKNY